MWICNFHSRDACFYDFLSLSFSPSPLFFFSFDFHARKITACQTERREVDEQNTR